MDVELFKPFKLAFWVFQVTGMWQDGNQTWTYFILGHLVSLVMIELYIGGVLVFAYNAQTIKDVIDAFGIVATQTAEMFKCWNLFYKLKNVKKSLETLNSLLEFSADDRWKSRNHVKSQVAFGLKIYKAFWFTAWTTCISGAFVPFITHKLPYKVWFPFETENNEIGFWVASIFLIVASFYLSALDITLDMLPVIFMTFGVGLINELAERLSEIGKKEEKAGSSEEKPEGKSELSEKEKLAITKEFIKCIEIHDKIREFVKEIHGNFSTAILLQGIMSSIILCTSAFTMSTVRGKKKKLLSYDVMKFSNILVVI
jgi:7tm Odorant receptor